MIAWDNLLKYSFGDDCQELDNLKNYYLDFDKVRMLYWPQLRSVDMLRMYGSLGSGKTILEMTEISDFRDMVESIKDDGVAQKSWDKEQLKKAIVCEYRGKLMESLIIISMIFNDMGVRFDVNRIIIRYYIVLCLSEIDDIRKLEFLRIKIESVIGNKGSCRFKLSSEFKDKNQ